MSLRHAIYLSCDFCGGAVSEHRDTEELARNKAERDGWRPQIVHNEDMCPDCVKVRRENHRGLGVPRAPSWAHSAAVVYREDEVTQLMSEPPKGAP